MVTELGYYSDYLNFRNRLSGSIQQKEVLSNPITKICQTLYNSTLYASTLQKSYLFLPPETNLNLLRIEVIGGDV